MFHIVDDVYKHGFLASDVSEQVRAINSINPNARCMSKRCMRESEDRLAATVKYVLPEHEDSNGERSFYEYVVRPGQLLNTETGENLGEFSPEQLHERIQHLFDYYHKNFPLRFNKVRVSYRVMDETGEERVVVREDRNTIRKRVLKTGNLPYNKPQFPIGG